jgi:hypothetical protein
VTEKEAATGIAVIYKPLSGLTYLLAVSKSKVIECRKPFDILVCPEYYVTRFFKLAPTNDKSVQARISFSQTLRITRTSYSPLYSQSSKMYTL